MFQKRDSEAVFVRDDYVRKALPTMNTFHYSFLIIKANKIHYQKSRGFLRLHISYRLQ